MTLLEEFPRSKFGIHVDGDDAGLCAETMAITVLPWPVTLFYAPFCE
jgi:hypothetical protein